MGFLTQIKKFSYPLSADDTFSFRVETINYFWGEENSFLNLAITNMRIQTD